MAVLHSTRSISDKYSTLRVQGGKQAGTLHNNKTMKYLAFLIVFILLLPPVQVDAAVAHDSSGASTLEVAGTSHSFSFTNTAGSFMVVVIENRLSSGGCGTTDIDALSVTYNGVALTFQKGTATDGVLGGAGACIFGHLLTLVNPATGANTLALSWTGTANVSVAVKTFSGAGSIGTISEDISKGNFTVAPTITADDLVMGALAIADNTANFSMNQNNQVETSDGGGNVGAGANTAAGTGAVTVSGSYNACCYALWWGVPILASVAVVSTPPPQDAIFFE
jgi:hypothetical protein